MIYQLNTFKTVVENAHLNILVKVYSFACSV